MANLTPKLQKKLGGSLNSELVELTAPATGDTFVSFLSCPLVAFSVQQTGTESINTVATVSGKTITIVTNAGGDNMTILVFGY